MILKYSHSVLPLKGFTLILTISLLVLLTMIAIAVMSLSSVSLRAATSQEAANIARANARLALQLALGDLQKISGKDQNVTARAEILTGNVANPQWTGVWNSTNNTSTAQWLVSGNTPTVRVDPKVLVSGEKATLISAYQQGITSVPSVEAPSVAIQNGQPVTGRYAYWISDEASKAIISLNANLTNSITQQERIARASLAQQYGIEKIGTDLTPLSDGSATAKVGIITLNTASVVTGNRNLPRIYQHDLTTNGYGLPVNTVDGGMKKDLSVLFDTTNSAHNNLMASYFGASPSAVTQSNGTQISRFTPPTGANGKKFFLIDELSNNGNKAAGPNWGNLYNYYQQYKIASFAEVKLASPDPFLYTDIRLRSWAPYNLNAFVQNTSATGTFSDTQQTNSAVHPTLSMLQMGFRLKSKQVAAATGTAPARFRLLLEVKPVVGLWNPYNASLPAEDYSFEWGLFSYVRLKITVPASGAQPAVTYTPRLWTRELWNSGNFRDGIPDRWIRMIANDVDLKPGEFRMFSVSSPANILADNPLTPSWGNAGAFVMEVRYNGTGGAPASGFIDVPDGSTVQIEELCIEDRQNPETLVRWPALEDKYATTWFTLKSSGGSLNRFQDLWTSGTKGVWEVPERVKPASAPSFSIRQLAAVQEHIATFSLRLRNSNEVSDTQGLRGWMDCNPRGLSMNPRWDGSKSTPALDGLWLTSPFMTPSGQGFAHTDGGPDGRLLIALGSGADESPQANFAGGRYLGYGGSSSRAGSGQNQAPIFDVPRAPLTSLAQFQHAGVARYNYEPAFAIGNSYANPRLSTDKTLVTNYNGIADFNLTDNSFLLNRKLWDAYFFSTLSSLHKGSSQAIDTVMPLQTYASGATSLPNPRMMLKPFAGDTSYNAIMNRDSSLAAEAIAARIRILGAFNVNSTSKNAWKAVLASMANDEMPTLSSSGALTWNKQADVNFSHFSVLLDATGYQTGAAGSIPSAWLSNRRINDQELELLAERIVAQVKERGPFRSLAAFVNRDPTSTKAASRNKGALQTALDQTINGTLPVSIGKKVSTIDGTLIQSNTFDATIENQAAGNSCYLTQADVLQSIGSILQTRSDCFRIRTMGESRLADGKILARAYCEAVVQRSASYLDNSDRAETALASLRSNINRVFGRRYDMISFRWLNQNEI